MTASRVSLTIARCLLASVLFVACSGGSGGTMLGMGGNGGGGGGASAGTGMTCQDIRLCVSSCSNDLAQPCVDDCIARANADARMVYAKLAACTTPFCPTGAYYCGCEQQCLDGNCLAETDACTAGAFDLVCEELCH